GLMSWFLVGILALLVGLTWILGIMSTIVEPVAVGGVVAIVASPLVGWLEGHHVKRGLGAAIVLLSLVAIVVVIVGLLVGGILDVPLAGTIAIVTFVTAYIPYIGALVSGAFAVLLALGSQGTNTALIMLVIVILANGLLQNLFQPLAFGAALDLNPLAVLIVTI